MTLADIEKIQDDFLTPEQVAALLGCDPNTLRWQAQHESDKLGFPVIVTKSRTRIPKEGLLHFCRYGRPQINIELRPESVEYYISNAMNSILERERFQQYVNNAVMSIFKEIFYKGA